VFVQLQNSLNRIWKVDTGLRLGAIQTFIKERLLSLAMVLGIGFLLLVSLLVNTALTAVSDSARATVGDSAVLLHTVNALGSFTVITGLFAMIFKVLPDAPVTWRDVWFGAVLTSVLFTLGKFALGIYLGHAGLGSAYGAAGSVVVMTAWVYYASMILLFGAELTYVRSGRTRADAPARQP
jgi:membrane protein